jgi:hypothetical protein
MRRARARRDRHSDALDLANRTFKTLRLPAQVSVETVRQLASELAGQPVQIEEKAALSRASTGYTFALGSKFIVQIAAGLPPLLRQQTVLHELAHLFIGIEPDAEPLFDAVTGRVAFYRGNSDSVHERATEILADQLAAEIRNSSQEPANFERVFG